MKKTLSILLVALLALASVFASGSAENAPVTAKEGTGNVATDPHVTLIYAEVNPLDTIVGKIAVYFKEKVEELSGGSITIDIQASGVLGSESDVLDSMLGGGTSIDLSRISAISLTSYGAEKSVLLTLPFMFESREHFWNFANSELAAEFLYEPQEVGLNLRGLFYGEEGFRHFFTVKPIAGIEDLKGLKLRVSNDPIMTGMVTGLGASPTVVSFGELYSALQTGVVDGAEQPIANYRSNAFQEVAPYLILDGHQLGVVEVVVSDYAWAKLTEDQQNVLYEAGALTQKYCQEISEGAEQEVLEQLIADGYHVIDVEDKSPWADAVSAVTAPYENDLFDYIMALK